MPVNPKGKARPASGSRRRPKVERKTKAKAAASPAASSPSNEKSEPMNVKPVKEPDPDLPTVENILEKAVTDITESQSKSGRRRSKSSVLDSVVELLADCLVIDISECRRRMQANEKTESETRPALEAKKTVPKRKRSELDDEGKIDKEETTAAKRLKSSDAATNSTVSDHGLEEISGIVDVSPDTLEPFAPQLRAPPKRARGANREKRNEKVDRTPIESNDSTDAPAPVVPGDIAIDPGQMADISPKLGPDQGRNREREVAITTDTVEEEVLNEGVGDIEFTPEKSLTPAPEEKPSEPSPSLPWWRGVESRMAQSERQSKDEDVLRAYIETVARSCLHMSWKNVYLKELYDKDPSSPRGRAYVGVSNALLMMERARHMGQCRTKWRPELIDELLHRRGFEWSMAPTDASFPQFTGCEVCLGHRVATRRLHLSGPRYDARNFWPSRNNLDILSFNEEKDGSYFVAAQLSEDSKPGRILTKGDEDDKEPEFWVDAQCLRKCLVFHELVHSTNILAEDLRYLIEDALRDGCVKLPVVDSSSPYIPMPGESVSVSDRLEMFLVQEISQNKDFVRRRVEHFIDIVRLGNIYFSAGDAEILDSGGNQRGDVGTASKRFDAPLELNDDKYDSRLQKLESLTEKKSSRASSPIF